VKIPLQLHFGSLDDIKGFSDAEVRIEKECAISPLQLQAASALEERLKSGAVTYEFNRYDKAHHAFMNETNPHFEPSVAR